MADLPQCQSCRRSSYEEYKANLRRNAQNFRITDEHLGEGGPKAKFQANVNAIRLLKELESAGQQASPEQQEILSRYVAGAVFLMLLTQRNRHGLPSIPS